MCGQNRRGASAKSPRNRGPVPRTQGAKRLRLADGEEAAVLAPVVAEPVEVEHALGAVPVEAGHVAAAVRVDPGRAEAHDRQLSLHVGVGRPEREELRQRRRAEAVRLEVCEHRLGTGVLVQVNQLRVDAHHSLARQREVLGVDVAVAPVVVTGSDHRLDRLPEVDDDRVETRLPTHDNPVGVAQESLQVLPRHAAGLRLGDQLAQLLHRDFHRVSPRHLLPSCSTPDDLSGISLPMVDRHLQMAKGLSSAFF